MDSKYILDNFKRQLHEKIERQVKIKNIILSVIVLSLFVGFIYIVYKQVSIAKYFFL